MRDRHADNNGMTFSWDNPPNGVHPGEDYNCRCWAEPIEDSVESNPFNGLESELEDTPQLPTPRPDDLL